MVLSAAYVGSRGLFLPFGTADLNQLDLGTIGQYGYSLCVDPSNPRVPDGAEHLGGNPALHQRQLRRIRQCRCGWRCRSFPQFGNGSYGGGNGVLVHGYPGGDSEYSSLQTKLQKRLSNHFTSLVSFTWAKLITDDGNPPLGFVGSHLGAAQDWKNLQYRALGQSAGRQVSVHRRKPPTICP